MWGNGRSVCKCRQFINIKQQDSKQSTLVVVAKTYLDVCVFQEWRTSQLRSDKYAKITDCKKILLTRQRLLPLRETVAFFHIVGTEPGFKRLSVPFMCTAWVKQSLVKWKGHTPNVPFGLKSFLC